MYRMLFIIPHTRIHACNLRIGLSVHCLIQRFLFSFSLRHSYQNIPNLGVDKHLKDNVNESACFIICSLNCISVFFSCFDFPRIFIVIILLSTKFCGIAFTRRTKFNTRIHNATFFKKAGIEIFMYVVYSAVISPRRFDVQRQFLNRVFTVPRPKYIVGVAIGEKDQ